MRSTGERNQLQGFLPHIQFMRWVSRCEKTSGAMISCTPELSVMGAESPIEMCDAAFMTQLSTLASPEPWTNVTCGVPLSDVKR